MNLHRPCNSEDPVKTDARTRGRLEYIICEMQLPKRLTRGLVKGQGCFSCLNSRERTPTPPVWRWAMNRRWMVSRWRMALSWRLLVVPRGTLRSTGRGHISEGNFSFFRLVPNSPPPEIFCAIRAIPCSLGRRLIFSSVGRYWCPCVACQDQSLCWCSSVKLFLRILCIPKNAFVYPE